MDKGSWLAFRQPTVRLPRKPASTLPKAARTPRREYDERSHSDPAASRGIVRTACVPTTKRVIGGTMAVPDDTGSGETDGTRTWPMRRSRPLGVRSAGSHGSARNVPAATAARKSASDHTAMPLRRRPALSRLATAGRRRAGQQPGTLMSGRRVGAPAGLWGSLVFLEVWDF